MRMEFKPRSVWLQNLYLLGLLLLIYLLLLITLESPLDCTEIKPVNPKGNQPWIFIGRTDAEAEAPILWSPDVEPARWKRPWCWERVRTGRDGDNRGWHGWMASPTRWTWVWASSRSWWWTGRPGVLQSMRSQRVRDNLATEQQLLILASMAVARLNSSPTQKSL